MAWTKLWEDDDLDVTDKKIDIWHLKDLQWKNMGISITSNDGTVQSTDDGGWELTRIPVNMKQIKERVQMFLDADLPCFEDIPKDTRYLVTMRNDLRDINHINLAECIK